MNKEMMLLQHPLENTVMPLAAIVFLSSLPPSLALPTKYENMETHFGKCDLSGPQM
jgi:hypothetical protein